MTTQITSITINGSSIALSDIEYAIYVTHGRSNVTDSATASTLSMTIFCRTSAMPTVAMAQMVNVQAHSKPRFLGRITDLEIIHLKDGYARFNIQAIGKVSRLGTKFIESTSFAKEVSHPRAEEILRQSGEDFLVEGGYETEVKAQTIEHENILGLLQKLADDAGAAIVDTPDGKILCQFYDSRGTSDYYEKWQDQGNRKWTNETERWIDKQRISPTAGIPLALAANTVIFEPIWRMGSGAIINKVILGYDNGSTYTTEDLTSQSTYGLRTLDLVTELYNLASATTRAGQILARQSYPRWAMGSVEILMDQVTDSTQRGKIMDLICGKRVYITGLPTPAPYTNWVGVVEGWSESYVGTGNGTSTHRITLALSDPFASYAGITWSALSTQKWNTINTSVIWSNAITVDSLV